MSIPALASIREFFFGLDTGKMEYNFLSTKLKREVLDGVICTYVLGEWDPFSLANLDIFLMGGMKLRLPSPHESGERAMCSNVRKGPEK